MPAHHHQQVTTNAPTQLVGALNTQFKVSATCRQPCWLRSVLSFTQTKGNNDNQLLEKTDIEIREHAYNLLSNTATDNIVGDNRLLTDIEIREHAYQLILCCDQLFDVNMGNFLFYFHGDCFIDKDFFFQPAIFFFVPLGIIFGVSDYILCTTIAIYG